MTFTPEALERALRAEIHHPEQASTQEPQVPMTQGVPARAYAMELDRHEAVLDSTLAAHGHGGHPRCGRI